MADIAPELFEKIRKDYEANISNSKKIQAALKKADQGKADYITAYDYAKALADCLSKALNANISEDILPNGRMYYNIAERVVNPLLTALEDETAAYCDRVQKTLNDNAGIGMNPV